MIQRIEIPETIPVHTSGDSPIIIFSESKGAIRKSLTWQLEMGRGQSFWFNLFGRLDNSLRWTDIINIVGSSREGGHTTIHWPQIRATVTNINTGPEPLTDVRLWMMF